MTKKKIADTISAELKKLKSEKKVLPESHGNQAQVLRTFLLCKIETLEQVLQWVNKK